MADELLTVIAQISKVQTLADGGVRWTFDGPEDAVMQSAALMEMKRLGYAVKLLIEPINHGKNEGKLRKIHI